MELIIKKLTVDDLITIVNEINMPFIDEDALIRKVCSEIYVKSPKDITLSQMLNIMPIVAKELAIYTEDLMKR